MTPEISRMETRRMEQYGTEPNEMIGIEKGVVEFLLRECIMSAM